MKIQNNRTVYFCEFCNKYRLTKRSMVQHEYACSKNPDSKRECNACNSLTTIEVPYNDGFGGANMKLPYCDKKKVIVIVPKYEIEGMKYRINEEYIAMSKPGECKHFKERLPYADDNEYDEDPDRNDWQL